MRKSRAELPGFGSSILYSFSNPKLKPKPNLEMSHTAHLVFKPSGQDYDLSGLLFDAPSYIIAREVGKVNKHEHYHICFRVEACEQTIRTRILSALNIPKTGRGKGNTHYTLKWDAYKNWSPEYPAKSGDIISSKGFTEDEIEDAIFRGSIKYNKQVDENNKGANIDVSQDMCQATVASPPPASACEWDRLLHAYKQSDKSLDRSCVNIKRWIKSYYLLRSRPIPRDGDLKRWSYSLYAIVHNQCAEDDQAVLEQTQEIYL